MMRAEWLEEMRKEIEKNDDMRKAFWDLFIQLHPQKTDETAEVRGKE